MVPKDTRLREVYSLIYHYHYVTLLIYATVTDIECKIVYVGSAESEEHDQVLDSVLVGPVPAGKHLFVFEVHSC